MTKPAVSKNARGSAVAPMRIVSSNIATTEGVIRQGSVGRPIARTTAPPTRMMSNATNRLMTSCFASLTSLVRVFLRFQAMVSLSLSLRARQLLVTRL